VVEEVWSKWEELLEELVGQVHMVVPVGL